MSLDPLVTIILLIYFTTVLVMLIVWLIIASNITVSWPLPRDRKDKVKSVNSKRTSQVQNSTNCATFISET